MSNVKTLLSQLRGAADAIKAQIHEADKQIEVLNEERRALADAPVSKVDFMGYVRADIGRRAAQYPIRLKQRARKTNFPPSFVQLERTHNLDPPLVPGGAPTISGVKRETFDGLGSAASAAPLAQTAVIAPDNSAAAAQAIIAAQAADAAQVPLAASNAILDAAMAAHALVPSEIAAVQAGPDLVAAPSLFQPFTPAECSPLSFNFGSPNTGGTYAISLDVCTHVATIRNIFSWVLYLLTAALLFQMFTRRPDGAEG